MNPLNSPGYIKFNPQIAYVNIPMATMLTFLNRILTVFFACVSPASSVAKPRCIMNTKNAETNIQVLFIVNMASATVGVPLAYKGAPQNRASNM